MTYAFAEEEFRRIIDHLEADLIDSINEQLYGSSHWSGTIETTCVDVTDRMLPAST